MSGGCAIDTAVGGQETVLHLRVRRFRCGNDDCAAKTFAEQVPNLTVRYGRYSVPLRTMLQAITLALGGRAGARLTHRLAVAVNRMTLIRLIRSLPDPATHRRTPGCGGGRFRPAAGPYLRHDPD